MKASEQLPLSMLAVADLVFAPLQSSKNRFKTFNINFQYHNLLKGSVGDWVARVHLAFLLV
jgi:hypothetical protein